jgi:hypothetical protein
MSYFKKVQLQDGYGFGVENTPMDEQRVVIPTRLVGSTFDGATVDGSFWTTAATGTGATSSQLDGVYSLASGTTSSGTASMQSIRTGRYIGAASNRYRSQIYMDAAHADNIRRWGCFNVDNGAFFELNGTTFNVVTRKRVGATVTDTPVASASWNGSTTTPTVTVINSYEIYYTNKSVYFVINGVKVHTFTATNTAWSATKNFPVRAESTNTAGTTSYTLNVLVSTIIRLGQAQTVPQWKYLSGTGTLTCKLSQGTLHSIIIGGVASGAIVTVYDQTTAATPIIWASGAMPNNTNPFAIDFKGMPFFTGLVVVISAQNANVTVIYE